MNQPDSDLVRQIAATLRTERTGQNVGSGFTRARVLNSVRAQRKRRSRWWRLGFPVGILLAGTSAWASVTDNWSTMLEVVEDVFHLPLIEGGRTERWLPAFATRVSTHAAHRALAAAAPSGTSLPLGALGEGVTQAHQAEDLPREAASTEPSVAEPVTDAPGSAHPAGRASARLAAAKSGHQKEASAAGVVPVQSALAQPSAHVAPAPPALDAEIIAFREADDAYRRSGNLQAASEAYARYVQQYPGGRFVPEATFNRALALLKLGRGREARPLLERFASGDFGAYRKRAAEQLLEALGD